MQEQMPTQSEQSNQTIINPIQTQSNIGSVEPSSAPQKQTHHLRNTFLILILGIFGLVFVFLLVAWKSGGLTVNTYQFAKLTALSICTTPDKNSNCLSNESVINSNTPVIYTSAIYKEAPVGKQVTIRWKYLDSGIDIASTIHKIESKNSSTINGSFSRPTAGWPIGKYQVEMEVVGDLENKVVQQFEVQ